MSHTLRNLALTTAAFVGASCSSPETSPAPSPETTISDTTATSTDSVGDLTDELAANGFEFREDSDVWTRVITGDSSLAEVQHGIGLATISYLTKGEPITVTVDGIESQVSFSPPKKDVIRAIGFVAGDSEASVLLGEGAVGSQTQLAMEFDGEELSLGNSIGVVSQEGEAYLIGASTEYCMTLDMDVVEGPPIDVSSSEEAGADYISRKEAACNSIGRMADVTFAMRGDPEAYSVYVGEVEDRLLQGEAAHNANIPYTVFPRQDFDRMVQDVNAVFPKSAASTNSV